MKKILYIATAATLLMTSCQKTDVLNVVEDTIEFGTEVGKLTKADGENYADEKYVTLKNQGFRVWAVSNFSIGEDQKGQIYRGLKNLPVIYNQPTTSGWGFDPTKVTNKYLWPQTGNELYFYSVSSAKAESWLGYGENDAITNKFLFTGETPAAVTSVEFPMYEVDGTAHDDIMVADAICQDKGDSKTVEPIFRHTMTKVVFNFKKGGPADDGGAQEASEIVLKSITTTPLQYKGKLTFTYGNGSTGTPSQWVPEADTKIFSKQADYTLTTESTSYATWYMIPQTLADATLDEPVQPETDRTLSGAVVTITYVADGKTITQNFDLNISSDGQDWTEEHCVRYNFTIAPHKIEFKPSVDEWTEQNSDMSN